MGFSGAYGKTWGCAVSRGMWSALHCGAGDALEALLCGGVYGLPWLAGDAVEVVLCGRICGMSWVALWCMGCP